MELPLPFPYASVVPGRELSGFSHPARGAAPRFGHCGGLAAAKGPIAAETKLNPKRFELPLLG